MLRGLLSGLSALLLSASLSVPAVAADIGGYPTQTPTGEEPRVYFSLSGDPRVPFCDEGAVSRTVKRQIRRADESYYGGLTISEINYIQETGFQLGNPSPVARRYCAARAILSDGSHRALYYMVVEHDGFVGVSWNVQACLDGLDKYRVYDGRCRTVRISPF